MAKSSATVVAFKPSQALSPKFHIYPTAAERIGDEIITITRLRAEGSTWFLQVVLDNPSTFAITPADDTAPFFTKTFLVGGPRMFNPEENTFHFLRNWPADMPLHRFNRLVDWVNPHSRAYTPKSRHVGSRYNTEMKQDIRRFRIRDQHIISPLAVSKTDKGMLMALAYKMSLPLPAAESDHRIILAVHVGTEKILAMSAAVDTNKGRLLRPDVAHDGCELILDTAAAHIRPMKRDKADAVEGMTALVPQLTLKPLEAPFSL